jgi:hypothetical protein
VPVEDVLIRHAFEELRLVRIVTCTHRENRRSIALLRRLGMRIEPDATQADGVLATLENDLPLHSPDGTQQHERERFRSLANIPGVITVPICGSSFASLSAALCAPLRLR